MCILSPLLEWKCKEFKWVRGGEGNIVIYNKKCSAVMNIGVYLFELESSSFLDICPAVGLLDHMLTLFLVFYGTAILFSKSPSTDE